MRRWGLLLCCCGHGELLLVDSARLSCCWELGQFVQQSAQQPLCACVLSPSEREKLCQISTRSFRYGICKQSVFQACQKMWDLSTLRLCRWDTISGGLTAVCVCVIMCENMRVLCMCAKNLCLPSFKFSLNPISSCLIPLMPTHWNSQIWLGVQEAVFQIQLARKRLEAKPAAKRETGDFWLF